ncbi:MAG: DUF4202 domain-containing protein [Cytophagales bacterium]|nr:DUF4202 domain-containing protein [Cytophagales bacterium]
MPVNKFDQAIQLFDEYNSRDPKSTQIEGKRIPENLLYGRRMTERLLDFEPDASEHLRLAARSQHIGRWEIPRKNYPMDRKGYLQWRSQLKIHHAKLAASILEKVGYDEVMIGKVKELLVKKGLKQNPETQTLENVICLVFLEYYFDDFSEGHEEEKLVGILQKTIAKMSDKGVEAALRLPLSGKAGNLIAKACD